MLGSMFNNAIRSRNGTSKNDRGQWKPIPPDMIEYFRNIPYGCEWVFYRKDRRAVINLWAILKGHGSGASVLRGVHGLKFHDTRNISGSALVDNGTPEQVVMTVAGWRTNMLKSYYHREPKKSLGLVRFSGDPVSACTIFSTKAEAHDLKTLILSPVFR